MTELREIADDRLDLLGEVADIMLGASFGKLGEEISEAAARLCIAAGESLIPETSRFRGGHRTRPVTTAGNRGMGSCLYVASLRRLASPP